MVKQNWFYFYIYNRNCISRRNLIVIWNHFFFFQLYLLRSFRSKVRMNGQTHELPSPREEIAFTARPKIQSKTQIFRYGRSIFCLTHRPNFSDIFDLCIHWLSVVLGQTKLTLFLVSLIETASLREIELSHEKYCSQPRNCTAKKFYIKMEQWNRRKWGLFYQLDCMYLWKINRFSYPV